VNPAYYLKNVVKLFENKLVEYEARLATSQLSPLQLLKGYKAY